MKEAKGYKVDTELTVEDLKTLVEGYKAVIREQAGVDFPTNPWDQLWVLFALYSIHGILKELSFTVEWKTFPGEWVLL